jgi:predicted negative regulator of RcsB-dependent stress response
VIKHSRNNLLKQLAGLRAARILLMQNKLDEALIMLNTTKSSAFSPYTALLKGEINRAQGHLEEAQYYFQTASQQLAQLQLQSPLLSLLISTPLPDVLLD